MRIIDTPTGESVSVVVKKLTPPIIKKLTKRRYWFDWRELAKNFPLYGLVIQSDSVVLGVMALAEYPKEYRLEIKLLASSRENVGAQKRYEGIVPCLLAFASAEAIRRYGEWACVSLTPKTELKAHYMTRYHMLDGGRQVFLEGRSLIEWAKKYFV